ncbi:unnamed protein product [Protopolystoma xenopodis]|uniref:Reverse transcriptase domain-containing protein n=1 Tax=Protopolystoma xenopodis TaxID=117903 RepID=A0A448WHL7_9PLAT|nr:unnamed protein product [Protopolystoma xenopodis]
MDTTLIPYQFAVQRPIYEQIFGLHMNSPLSPLLAVYMDKLEEKIKKSPEHRTVVMRYLDDYFALWSDGKEI